MTIYPYPRVITLELYPQKKPVHASCASSLICGCWDAGQKPCQAGLTRTLLACKHFSLPVYLHVCALNMNSTLAPTSKILILYTISVFHRQNHSTQTFCRNTYLDCNQDDVRSDHVGIIATLPPRNNWRTTYLLSAAHPTFF